MNYIHNLSIYLAGAIDNYDGENWRKKYLTKFAALGLNVYDPLIKPKWMSKVAGCKKLDDEVIINMKKGCYNFYKDDSKQCRDVCLSMLSHSDIMFVYLPKIFTLGTVEEILQADQQMKPIIFVHDKEFIVSLYMADLFSRHMAFNNFEKALDELNNINKYGINTSHQSIDFITRWLPITHKAL